MRRYKEICVCEQLPIELWFLVWYNTVRTIGVWGYEYKYL